VVAETKAPEKQNPKMLIAPLPSPPATRVAVPGSKSHTNRALLLAALAEGTTTLENALFSADSHYFAQALSDLGFEIYLEPDTKTITAHGLGGFIPASKADLFTGNAGTATRFLTALLTLGHGEYRLAGVERMHQRPIGDLVEALNGLGARVEGSSCQLAVGSWQPSIHSQPPTTNHQPPLCPPVTIHAHGLPGGKTSIRGAVSSQFLSALLMIAPYAHEPVEITVEGPLHSKPYIDLTISVMADFDVRVQRQGHEHFKIKPQRYQTPGLYTIESDASAASYFFAAPAICGGWVEVENISRDSRQGDISFLNILTKMGCTVQERNHAIRVTGPDRLPGLDINMADISDTFMTLAVIAPFADSPTTVRGIASSRLKETDRIAATTTELRRLGVSVDEYPDGLTITPCKNIQPAQVHTYDDHRIAMAFALIGLRVPGIEIQNPECVGKTFPNYFDVLKTLR